MTALIIVAFLIATVPKIMLIGSACASESGKCLNNSLDNPETLSEFHNGSSTSELQETYFSEENLTELLQGEQMPTEYLNTTDPYSDIVSPELAIEEIDDSEGSNPLYVLVFGDEEERATAYPGGHYYPYSWQDYATMQLERADEDLVWNFNIDIRILGFEQWDSNDTELCFSKRYGELVDETIQYRRQWYVGAWWSNYVDAIIGISNQQREPNDRFGAASAPQYIDRGEVCILLDWQVYWMDDNLARHEICHLFYLNDHINTCCTMAGHPHYQFWIWEDGLYFVDNEIPCMYTSSSWCDDCWYLNDLYRLLYQEYSCLLVIRHDKPESPKGALSFGPGVFTGSVPWQATISIVSTQPDYFFDHWEVIVGQNSYVEGGYSITILVDQKYTVVANYTQNVGQPLMPQAPSGPTSGYVYTEYLYSASTTDPDNDKIQYEFDWGDGSFHTTAQYSSGQLAFARHTWTKPGHYPVCVRAQDEHGATSGWSSHISVNICQNDFGTGGDAGNTSATATPIATSEEYRKGALYVFEDAFDWYKFHVDAGKEIRVSLISPSGANYDFQLFDNYGHLRYTSNKGVGCADYVYYIADSTGEWMVEICPMLPPVDGQYSLFIWVTSPGGGCPILFVYDGYQDVCEGLLDIHNPNGTDMVINHTLATAPQPVNGFYLFSLVEHPQTHSYIDQVKLYAVLENGQTICLPLVWAWHSEHGFVLPQLLFSDEWKTETLGANYNNGVSQSIQLRFLALPPDIHVVAFIFQIEGNNPSYKT